MVTSLLDADTGLPALGLLQAAHLAALTDSISPFQEHSKAKDPAKQGLLPHHSGTDTGFGTQLILLVYLAKIQRWRQQFYACFPQQQI